MGLTNTTYKLGSLLELCTDRNSDLQLGISDVRGISIQKVFIETKANMNGVSLRPYYLVHPDDFAYVTVTSRNGEKITIAHNDTKETYLVSSSYVVFRVKRPDILSSEYLFMYFNRPEFDRYARFNSWGSARETFSWDDMCDIDIALPPLEVQRKYAAIYAVLLANQKSYESGLEDLKLACGAYIEKLRKETPSETIGPYIHLCEERNEEGILGLDSVRGVSINKEFIETKAKMQGVSLRPYYFVRPGEFAFVPVTSRNGGKISVALNRSEIPYLCSSSYVVFGVNDENALLPSYLAMYFERSEFDRYARFHSWGSARETFGFDDMREVRIPIPDIEVQRAISDIYAVYVKRRELSDRLKDELKGLCPILIKGSLEEAAR